MAGHGCVGCSFGTAGETDRLNGSRCFCFGIALRLPLSALVSCVMRAVRCTEPSGRPAAGKPLSRDGRVSDRVKMDKSKLLVRLSAAPTIPPAISAGETGAIGACPPVAAARAVAQALVVPTLFG